MSIEEKAKQAIKEIQATSVDELEALFIKYGYWPTRKRRTIMDAQGIKEHDWENDKGFLD